MEHACRYAKCMDKRLARDLEERIWQCESEIAGLDVTIEPLYAVCSASGAASGNSIAAAWGSDSEDELRAAWRQVTDLGHQRKLLRAELATLRIELEDLRKHGSYRNVRAMAKPKTTRCAHCGKPAKVQRSTRSFCSNACRQAAYRERKSAA